MDFNFLLQVGRIIWELNILLNADFYDPALHFASILHPAEWSAARSVCWCGMNAIFWQWVLPTAITGNSAQDSELQTAEPTNRGQFPHPIDAQSHYYIYYKILLTFFSYRLRTSSFKLQAWVSGVLELLRWWPQGEDCSHRASCHNIIITILENFMEFVELSEKQGDTTLETCLTASRKTEPLSGHL